MFIVGSNFPHGKQSNKKDKVHGRRDTESDVPVWALVKRSVVGMSGVHHLFYPSGRPLLARGVPP